VTAYKRYSEKFYNWLLVGLVALLFEVGLSSTVLRKIP